MPVIKEEGLNGNAKQIKYRITEEGCWECISHHLDESGYAKIERNGKATKVHRYVFALKNNGITKGMHILHECDNPQCINPNHLFEGTNLDNIRDKIKKGRQAFTKGEQNGQAKLTVEDVREILKDNRRHVEVAKDYPVSANHICTIRNRKSWKHITV